MRILVGLALAAALGSAAPDAQQTVPVAGIVISASAALRPGTYALQSADLNHPAVVIRASNATIDFVDEWGPYDWKSPKLWPAGRSDVLLLKLRVLGPRGEWRVSSVRGAHVTPESGPVPGEITVVPDDGRRVDFDVRLTYRGASVTGPRGETTREGQPYTFGYSRFFVPIDWDVRYFEFDAASAPDADPDAFGRVVAGRPVKADRRDRLDFMSGGAIVEGVPQDRVAISAEGRADLPRGEYEIRTISDDGIRVWVDDDRVIDHWTSHESAVDTAPMSGGTHRIKVEYFELGGFAELRLEILKR